MRQTYPQQEQFLRATQKLPTQLVCMKDSFDSIHANSSIGYMPKVPCSRYLGAEAILIDQGFLTFIRDSDQSTELTSNAASGNFRKLACRLSFIQTASRSSNSAWTLDVALWTRCEKGS